MASFSSCPTITCLEAAVHVYPIAQSIEFCDPLDCSPPGSSVPADSPGKSARLDCHCSLPGDLPNPGMESMSLSPALQADCLYIEL